ncbi:MAG: hypothetical protein LBU32_07875 [Clostridiales bacterium]|jgi:two-component system sensor histidine kinase YesM|nr:hypothetical protein [Clostridiales bacterium]
MTLQPIIENALIHGLQKLSGRRGRIDVDIYAENSVVFVSVTDNGSGISEEKMNGVFSSDAGTSGFGLKNVNQRAILFSGSSLFG